MKITEQKKIVQTIVIQPEISHYECDRCGKICGTKDNVKETWSGAGFRANKSHHYCKKTCSPRDHPHWDKQHIAECSLCRGENNAVASL